MKEQSVSGVLGTTIEKIKNLVDVSTIIGEPIPAGDGITIIPVSKVTYGFGSGGSDLPGNKDLFAGGAGAGITIVPICFLVINKGEVSIKHISMEEGSVERVIGMVPDVIDTITGVVSKVFKKDGGEEEEDPFDFDIE